MERSSAGLILVNLAILLIIPIMIIIVIVPIPIFIILIPYRCLLALFVKAFRPDLHSAVSGSDSLLVIGNQAQGPLNILIANVLDGEMTPERFREKFQAYIWTGQDGKGEKVYQKLAMYYVQFLGYDFWKAESSFDLSQHIRYYDYREGHLHLPDVCREKDLRKIFAPLARVEWHQNKSPWEILFHTGYSSGDEESGKLRTLIILRFNHVLGDGMSLIEMMRKLSQCKLAFPQINFNARKKLGILQRIGLGVKVPYDVAKSLLDLIRSRKFRHYPRPKRREDTDWIYSVSSSVSVDVIKRIKNTYNVGFNSVVSSVILGAIQRAIENGGKDLPSNLSSFNVVPIPNHPHGMSNHALLLGVRLPCSSERAEVRLERIHRRLKSLRRNTAPLVSFDVAVFLATFVPNIFRTLWIRTTSAWCFTYGITNFPATISPDYLDGMELLDIFGIFSAVESFDMSAAVYGFNNRLRFNLFVEHTLFASETVTRSLGHYVDKELMELAESCEIQNLRGKTNFALEV